MRCGQPRPPTAARLSVRLSGHPHCRSHTLCPICRTLHRDFEPSPVSVFLVLPPPRSDLCHWTGVPPIPPHPRSKIGSCLWPGELSLTCPAPCRLPLLALPSCSSWASPPCLCSPVPAPSRSPLPCLSSPVYPPLPGAPPRLCSPVPPTLLREPPLLRSLCSPVPPAPLRSPVHPSPGAPAPFTHSSPSPGLRASSSVPST